jgi:tRNA threonylcarbamoyladenosine biosynthesis protein TsaE
MNDRNLKKDISFTEYISNSEEETVDIARMIAKRIQPGVNIALQGALGAGKSVFARGFARALGVEGYIPSPTFTIVQEYELDNRSKLKWLIHMDLYRIHDTASALSFGIDEYLDDLSAVKLIEWSERIEDILPDDTWYVRIKHLSELSRRIIIEN